MAKLVYRFLESAYKQYIEDWCAARGYKVEDWDYSNGFNGESFVSFAEFCDNEFKEGEVMQSVLSTEDFKFWESLFKEDIKINTYAIPTTWEVYADVEIEATSIEEAVEIFKETKDNIPLPTNSNDIDDIIVNFRLPDEYDLNLIRVITK